MSKNLHWMREAAGWYSGGGPDKLRLPFIHGKWYFVVPGRNTQGLDVAGTDPRYPLGNLEDAYEKCTSGNGDGICLISYGTTTAGCTSYLTSSLTWSKWGITVVGICAPTPFSQRARISTAAADLANLITVSGSNNSFFNISLYNGGTTGAGCVKVTGNRNYFENVHMMGGMGMSTPTVNDYSLYISGGDENAFINCTIGHNTFNKTDIAGAELLLGGGVQDAYFENCRFKSYRSAGTTAGMIKLVGSGDAITRTVDFVDCSFEMYRDGALSSEVSVIIGTMPNNGFIWFRGDRTLKQGFTDFSAVASARVLVTMPTSVNATSGGVLDNPS